MTWANIDLSVEQNSQLQDSWFWFNAPDQFGNPGDYVPIDFTGSTIKMQVRSGPLTTSTLIDTYGTATGEIVLAAGVISPGPALSVYNNGFTLTIVAARSSAITPGTYFYDLFQTSAGGIPTCLMRGAFDVISTVTR